MRKADHTEKKNQNRKSRKIYVTAIAAMLAIATFIGTYPATANVADNLAGSDISILGKLNDVVSGDFGTATTNAKLNRMKTDVDSVRSSVSRMIQPYVGSLTLWVDSNSGSYSGQTVTVTNAKGQSQTGRFVARNGHYEVDFPSILKGSYTVNYPYYLSNGTKIDLSCTASVTGSVKQQVFGDLQQMTMADVQAACKAGVINQLASVGDTFSGGTNYTYTIIGIDQDKPSDGNGNLLPSNSYGNVLTVMPLGAPAGKGNNQPVATNAAATPYGTTTAQMHSGGQNFMGWQSTPMRLSTMTDYYNRLPEATRKVIGLVQKLTGSMTNTEYVQPTGDSVFLLSGKEVFGGRGYGNGSYCSSSEASATFQYQYFSSIATSAASCMITGNNWWWLRSPRDGSSHDFCAVGYGSSNSNSADGWCGVFPAFCIY